MQFITSRQFKKLGRGLFAFVLLFPLFVFGGRIQPSQAQQASNPDIQAVYNATELPIITGQASRSWIWGPEAFQIVSDEQYDDAPGGKRLVQYYDKGRLELTNPSTKQVTAGLLAKELMIGQVQLGDNKFETRGPSSISVAGDPDDNIAPSYADLGLLFDKPAIQASTVITTFIRPDGTQAGIASLASYNVTAVEFRAGWKHNTANVFKSFIESTGVVYRNGSYQQGKIFDSTAYDPGLPLTEPYWTRAKIGGKVQDVLVQGFERRVLSYTPGNPEAYRVEAGNVGRHYYQWRNNVIEVQLLGTNDIHGRLLPEVVNGVNRGGVAYFSTLIKKLRATNPNTFTIHAGDSVGATQIQSALLQDEPTIDALNRMGFDVGSVGNHEFDKGLSEALRITKGGKNPERGNEFGGANFPYLVANLEDKTTGKPPMDPYVIIERNGIRIAVIGAVTKDLNFLVSPAGIANLNILDEATGINKYIPEIKQKGADIIVVTIHEGGIPTVADGQEQVTGPIVDIAAKIDPAVDVIISGHTHQEYVSYMSGKLVTQSGFYTRNVTSLRLQLDKTTKKILSKRAVNVPVINSELTPDPEVAPIVQKAVDDSAPIANRKITTTAATITRTQNAAGESALGNLIADAQRSAMKADFAFMNPGGIRADQQAGDVTFGSLFAIQPFGNIMNKIEITGDQIYRILEQQWQANNTIRFLQISGLSYTWDNSKGDGQRVVEVRGPDGKPLDRTKTYTAAINNFLAAGGDNFRVFTECKLVEGGPVDLDALIDYVQALPQPLVAPAVGDRIKRLN